MKSKFFLIIPVVVFILLLFDNSYSLQTQEAKNPLLESWQQYVTLKKSSQFDLKWIQLGPTMNSARVEAVQCHPERTGTWYVAFGSGNLWKTTNHGLTWKPIFENQPALGIGDIALSPSHPDTIWLGSGESLKKARNFTMPGVGVFRSDDGGETWKNMGLHDSYHIGEIAVHPKNPDIVLVAVMGHFWSTNTNRGLYRTINGGKTWEHVLYVNERAGANDVVFAPSNPDVVYVSLWENNPGICGKESGIYKSIDGGKNFTCLRGGFPEGPKIGRIGLAVSWSNPDKVYALVDNLSKKEDLAAEVYRTLDGGKTWTRTHQEELLIFPGIGWYFADCYVNPRDDEEIFALGVRMAHSSDGGKTFGLVGGDVYHLFPSAGHCLHLDHCELWINPKDPNQLALGNDGGFYFSYDKGESWLHYNNIPTGEFYDISVDNQNPYYIYGGTQDDSSVYGPSREWKPEYPDTWEYLWIDAWSGGDGCVNIPDPEDPNTVYISAQHGFTIRKDIKTQQSKRIGPQLPKGHKGKLAYEFVAPYIISPHNRLTLYQAGNYVFKSLNQGDEWRLISPNLADSAHEGKKSRAAGTIAESFLQPGLLYVGTDKGAFWVTHNDGLQWIEFSSGLPNYYIRSICPSRFTKSRVYVAVTGINNDDLRNYLFVSENYGKNWKSISGNLPDEVAYVILEDPVCENILYAGLYRGVYISTDRGQNWSLLGPHLAATAISDLVIQEREMDLVAGTHGRGIYKMNIRAFQEAFRNGVPQENILFKTPVARQPWFNDIWRYPSYRTMEKVPITFYLLRDAEVTVSVSDGKGRRIWSKIIRAHKGFNQVWWDLVTKRVDSKKPYFIHYLKFAKPGTYQLNVTGKGIELVGKLTVVSREFED